MYVTTFYSFKGGVGRTLATVNVAVELALRGRRVLMVDFDLEAPGLSSFQICEESRKIPGVVDFVLHYLEHNETPDIKSYVVECRLEQKEPGGGALFVMPAGKTDDAYGRKLSRIDWTALYEKRDGYLVMEDLKHQWEQALKPDYVIIDSRTGHTEESGICTRQLADAVVIMFFPNEQNLLGVKKVVSDIRRDSKARRRDVGLHFVTSNVPDLDDEDRILHQRLNRFKKELDYKELQTIHHYPSLALLNQEIFVLKRPRSRLATEYRQLFESIIEQNLNDRTGAIALLRRMSSSGFEPPSRAEEREVLEARLVRLRESHPKDGQIAVGIANVYARFGRLDKAKALLDTAIADGLKDAEAFRQRARVNVLLGRMREALDDLERVLTCDGAAFSDVMLAFQVFAEGNSPGLARVLESKAFRSLSAEHQAAAADALLDREETIGIAQTIYRSLLAKPSPLPVARVGLSLCLIHAKRFSEVMELLGPRDRLFNDGVEVPDIFNFAMAEWGARGRVPVHLMKRFVDSAPPEQVKGNDANFYQCLAIASWGIDDLELARKSVEHARAKISTSLVPTFSAWQYLTVPPDQFQEDLDALAKMIKGENVHPMFFDSGTQREH